MNHLLVSPLELMPSLWDGELHFTPQVGLKDALLHRLLDVVDQELELAIHEVEVLLLATAVSKRDSTVAIPVVVVVQLEPGKLLVLRLLRILILSRVRMLGYQASTGDLPAIAVGSSPFYSAQLMRAQVKGRASGFELPLEVAFRGFLREHYLLLVEHQGRVDDETRLKGYLVLLALFANHLGVSFLDDKASVMAI